MEYTDETLAGLIENIDPGAGWVYNRHCEYCGKFLYPEETTRCKKCHTPTDNALRRPIPFLQSATAIEKLILWVRSRQDLADLKGTIAIILARWLDSERDASTYRLEILIQTVNKLEEMKHEQGN